MTDAQKQAVVKEFTDLSGVLDMIHSSPEDNILKKGEDHLQTLWKQGNLNDFQYHQLVGEKQAQALGLIAQLMKKSKE